MDLTLEIASSSVPASASADGDVRQMALELLQREEPAIRRVIGRYVHQASAIDDIYQEVCVKTLRRAYTVREPEAVRGWVFQLARNACIDMLRQAGSGPRKERGLVLDNVRAKGEQAWEPDQVLLTRERVSAIHTALAELPPSQQVAIRLRIEEGLDHGAIAKRLGISREAVEVRLCRGRAALKARLDGILDGDA